MLFILLYAAIGFYIWSKLNLDQKDSMLYIIESVVVILFWLPLVIFAVAVASKNVIEKSDSIINLADDQRKNRKWPIDTTDK